MVIIIVLLAIMLVFLTGGTSDLPGHSSDHTCLALATNTVAADVPASEWWLPPTQNPQ